MAWELGRQTGRHEDGAQFLRLLAMGDSPYEAETVARKGDMPRRLEKAVAAARESLEKRAVLVRDPDLPEEEPVRSPVAEPPAPAKVAVETELPAGFDPYAGKDLRDPKVLAQFIADKLISAAVFEGNITLVCEGEMARMQEGSPMKIIWTALEDLTKQDKYKALRGKIRIARKGRESLIKHGLEKYYHNKGDMVFLFADAEGKERLDKVEEQATAAFYIDKKGFSPEAYYPLAEVIALAFAQHFYRKILPEGTTTDFVTINGQRFNIRDFNLESITLNGKALVFKLLPSALPVKIQELHDRYANLKRLIIAA